MTIPRWRLAMAITLFVVIVGLIVVGDSIIYLRTHTGALLEHLSAEQGIAVKIGKAKWMGWRKVRLNDLQVGPGGNALSIAQVTIQWKWHDLIWQHRISSLSIDQPKVWTGKLEELMKALDQKSVKSSSVPKRPYVLDHVVMKNGVLNLDKLHVGVPSIAVQFGKDKPIEFWNLPLGAGPSEQQDWPQSATAENVSITSPYDPLIKVLNFESIRLNFTWAGLAQSKIDHLELIAPTVYLGPDLFWFLGQVREKTSEEAAKHPAESTSVWSIHQLDLRGGKLVISAFGGPGVELPFLLASNAKDLRLDRLEDLSFNNEIKILPVPLEYPKYNISLEPKDGTLKFNLPPNQGDANNFVPTINFSRIRWRNIETTNAWASFTFDQHGISGTMGGEVYGGYINGNFDIGFGAGYPWKGWGYVTKVDVQPIVAKLTEGRFKMELSGQAFGSMNVSAHATSIEDTSMDLQLQPPGHLRIEELDRLQKNLPAKWSDLQRVGVGAVLVSFKDYSYSSAKVSAQYHFPESKAKLELFGKEGHRIINLHWAQDPSEPPLMELVTEAEPAAK